MNDNVKVGLKVTPEHFSQWLAGGASKRLLDTENAWLAQLLSRFYGMHLMYLGIDEQARFLGKSPVIHRFRAALPWQQEQVDHSTVMSSSDWPFADDQLDVVVLQHGLDFTRRPHQMIREAARSIVPNGYLIIVGFQPWSLWGAVRQLLPFGKTIPWVANPVSNHRLKDWLMLLDFRIESSAELAHFWPLSSIAPNFFRRVDRRLAGRGWINGSSYCLIAQKTVAGVTPIRTKRWRMPEPELGWASTVPRVNQQR